MHVFTWRHALVLGAVAVVTGCAVAIASGGGSVSTARTLRLTKLQRRILSGFASFELGQTPGNEATALQRAIRLSPIGNPAAADCPTHHGKDVKVNQNCLDISDRDLQGRGQAQNETAMSVDPRTGRLVATYNDYRRGDGTCGPSYSRGGTRWSDSTLPNNFVRGTPFGHVAREYFQASGDPSTAWDTRGNVYFSCQEFQRGPSVTNNRDNSSGIFMHRSTATGGASWNFPGRPVAQEYTTNTNDLPFIDKPYMTVDRSSSSRFRDRLYVTWSFFKLNGTSSIYEAHSDNYGESFSSPVLVSGTNAKLCPKGVTGPGNCDADQDSQPFTALNGTLYVVFDNYNNGTSRPSDNHNQILIAKSTNGGASFGPPVKVANFYDLPDCVTYQGGQDPGVGCVPEKGKSTKSVFRADNYPVGAVNPSKPDQVVVTFGSYINRDSNEKNGCKPKGLDPSSLLPLYKGVKKRGACNNKILYSVSNNGGASFTGTTTDPRKLPVIPQQRRQKRTDQFFQWAAFSPSGKLGVSYYDRQYGNDETTGASDVSLSASSGLKGFATVRVTSSSMPAPTQFPDTQGNSEFYGDYSGLAVRGNTAYPLWMDTRDPDLFLCPGTGSAGHPPKLCTGTSGSAGRRANDENAYTRAMSLP